jgi:hypothetical protein
MYDSDGTLVSVIPSSQKDSQGRFTILPKDIKKEQDSLVVAVCDRDVSNAYCKQTQTVKNFTMLLVYATADGVHQVSGTGDEWLAGVTRQIIRGYTTATLYKTWEGEIQYNLLPESGKVTIELMEGDLYDISAKFSGIGIPFSAAKYYKDPVVFFEDLGLHNASDGEVNGEDVRFNSDGTLTAKKELVAKELLQDKRVIASALGLSESEIESVDIRIMVKQGRGKSIGLIIGIVVGVLAAVAVAVGITIFYVRRKRKQGNLAENEACKP